MSRVVALRPLTTGERELLRTATLANVNWSGERLTSRDVDERPDLRHCTVFRPARGDLGSVADGVPGRGLAVTMPDGGTRISHPSRFGTDLDLPPCGPVRTGRPLLRPVLDRVVGCAPEPRVPDRPSGGRPAGTKGVAVEQSEGGPRSRYERAVDRGMQRNRANDRAWMARCLGEPFGSFLASSSPGAPSASRSDCCWGA